MNPKHKPYVDCIPLIHQGKVRDSFGGTTTPGTRLVVATDRISTHDVVHKSLVPGKGIILTAMTVFWALTVLRENDIPHHIVAYDRDIYDHLPKDREYPEDLHWRGLIVRDLDMIPYELIFRAYLAGSLWDKIYSQGRLNPYGVELPEGLELMSPLDPIIFTPTDKSETDDPVRANVVEHYQPEAVTLARDVYQRGREYALNRGIDIIDFKAEVGRDKDGTVVLADEWMTGDCCRFVRTNDIVVGKNPPWADKQIFRDWAAQAWKGMEGKPPLEFPQEVIKQGIQAYRGMFGALTGYDSPMLLLASCKATLRR